MSKTRDGRRRRVLQEEARSAVASSTAATGGALAGAGGRYAAAARTDSQVRVTQLIPRRPAVLACWITVGLSIVTGLTALDWQVSRAEMSSGMLPLGKLLVDTTTWLHTMAFAVAASTAVVIYLVRKHRVDDYRGRYRAWLWAAASLVALSANTLIGYHQHFADVMARVSGWSALPNNAIWWLAAAILLTGWILWRCLTDIVESRTATLAAALVLAAYIVAVVSASSWWPSAWEPLQPFVKFAAPLIGQFMFVTSLLLYARFISLDADGLIARRAAQRDGDTQEDESTKVATSGKRSGRQAAGNAAHTDSNVSRLSSRAEPVVADQRDEAASIQATKPTGASSSTIWVDGSEPIDDDYDDQPAAGSKQRKLSKSERKRLRRQKMRRDRRAA